MKIIAQKLDNGFTLSTYEEKPADPTDVNSELRERRTRRLIVETKEALLRKIEEFM